MLNTCYVQQNIFVQNFKLAASYTKTEAASLIIVLSGVVVFLH